MQIMELFFSGHVFARFCTGKNVGSFAFELLEPFIDQRLMHSMFGAELSNGFLSRKGREGDFRFERRGVIFPFGHDDSPCVRLSYHTCPNFGEHLFITLISSTDSAPLFSEQLAIHLSSKSNKNFIYENVQKLIQNMTIEEEAILISEIDQNKQNLKKEFDTLFNEKYTNISQKESFDFISHQEIQFFMRIIAPCLIIHGKFPSALLRRARLGDENIIKWLARLDNSVLKDSKIAQYIHKLSFNNPTKHKIFCRSLAEESSTLDICEIKISIATLISRVNLIFHKTCGSQRLNAEEIRNLFTQEARRHGLEDDFDLPASKEALYKRIKRNTIWDELFKLPDKF